LVSEILTPSEIEYLRQEKKEVWLGIAEGIDNYKGFVHNYYKEGSPDGSKVSDSTGDALHDIAGRNTGIYHPTVGRGKKRKDSITGKDLDTPQINQRKKQYTDLIIPYYFIIFIKSY